MITAVLAFAGAMLGSLFINFVLYDPNYRNEDDLYRNSGHHGPKD